MPAKKKKVLEDLEPMIAYEAQARDMSLRRNAAADIVRTDRFRNIENGISPFRYNVYDPGNTYLDVREAVILTQLAYWNFAVFRNVIDLMTEFSVGNIYFKGGTQKSRDFFSALFKKINLTDFQDKFYREYFRSGNVFIHRFDAKIKDNDVRKIIQVFGCEGSKAGERAIDQSFGNQDTETGMYDILTTDLRTNKIGKMEVYKNMLPTRYIILNPADVRILGTSNFSCGVYFKILSDFELTRLRNPMSEEDEQVFNSLPADAQKQIKVGSRTVIIPLNPHKILMAFYKKQDYEPFAVPMGFPVLEDINAKAEIKQIDMAIARTAQQAVLIVSHGAEMKDGTLWFNPKVSDKLHKLMANPSVSKTLVADWTTKAEWAIPEISDLLDPKKYEVLDRDINIGLNNVFMGGEKFANQQQRVELFITRLANARKVFIDSFLFQEVKRLSRNLGFRSFPTPVYEDIELKDHTQIQKIYERLAEIGMFTPQQTFEAIDKNILPDDTLFIEQQQEYKSQRDKGMFQPLIGGKPQAGGPNMPANGRPAGSTAPQTTKTITPIGLSRASVEEEPEQYSIVKIKENLLLTQELDNQIEKYLKKKFKIKKLNVSQASVAKEVSNIIVANEEPKDWLEKIENYCENPIDTNKERISKILEISAKHEISQDIASILLASKREPTKE